jgi:hypothetical protein
MHNVKSMIVAALAIDKCAGGFDVVGGGGIKSMIVAALEELLLKATSQTRMFTLVHLL